MLHGLSNMLKKIKFLSFLPVILKYDFVGEKSCHIMSIVVLKKV